MKIFIQDTRSPEFQEEIRRVLNGHELVENPSDAEIVIGNLPVSKLSENRSLKLVQLLSAGCTGYSALYASNPGIRVCCATGAYGRAVAEHMFSALLCMMKRLDGYAVQKTKRVWRDLGKAATIRNARVLVLGLGDIGGSFARMCRAMGAHVTGVRRSAEPAPEIADEVFSMDEIDRLLPEADVIAMALPDTPATRNVMSAERFSRVKRGAYLVNVGRGNAIDEDAFIRALETGALAGASVDVTAVEPLPENHPLWNAPNLLITPHVAGGEHLPIIQTEIIRIAENNVKAVSGEGGFISLVDAETGYRKK